MMTGKSPSKLVLDQSVENEIKETLAAVTEKLEITEETNNVVQASNLTPKNTSALLQNCTNSTQVSKTSKKHGSLITLTSLPPELVLLIFSYLDARFTLRVVCCVCKLFYHLLEPESSWKSRFSKRWPARDNSADYSYLSSWKKICVEHEDIDRFWFSSENKLDFFSLKQHFGPVDTVHLFAEGQMCASGSRDRSIAVWNLTNLRSQEDDRKAFKCSLDGHRGWVWSLSSDPTGESRICSGSWDSLVKIWDLQGAQPEMMTIRGHQAAVLCLVWKADILITGCYDKHVRMFDLRDGNQIIKSLKFHNKPVLCMDADDKFVITGSEDKTLRIFDRRAAKFYKSIQLESPAFSVSRNSSSGYNYLRVGGRDGKIYHFDTARDSFDVIEPCMDLGTFSRGKITGICHYGGAVVACSTDGSIKVLEPSRVPSLICSLDKHTQEVTSGMGRLLTWPLHPLDVLQVHSTAGILASCSSDLTVGIWRPQSLCPSSYM